MPKAMKPILDLAPTLSAPMLGLFGVEDRFPTPEAVATLDAELTRRNNLARVQIKAVSGAATVKITAPFGTPANAA